MIELRLLAALCALDRAEDRIRARISQQSALPLLIGAVALALGALTARNRSAA